MAERVERRNRSAIPMELSARQRSQTKEYRTFRALAFEQSRASILATERHNTMTRNQPAKPTFNWFRPLLLIMTATVFVAGCKSSVIQSPPPLGNVLDFGGVTFNQTHGLGDLVKSPPGKRTERMTVWQGV